MKYEKEFEQTLAVLESDYPTGFLLDNYYLFKQFFMAGVKAAEPSVKIQAIPALFKPME